MTPEMLQVFIPIVAILVVFGFPVALIFTLKWFKLKDKELQLESEMRKTSGQALEARVQRLESIILSLDADLRASPRGGTGIREGGDRIRKDQQRARANAQARGRNNG